MFLRSHARSQAIQVLLDDHAREGKPRGMRIQNRARLNRMTVVMSMIVWYGGWSVGMEQLEKGRWDASR